MVAGCMGGILGRARRAGLSKEVMFEQCLGGVTEWGASEDI